MSLSADLLIANLTSTSVFVDSFIVEVYSDSGLTTLVGSGSCGALSDPATGCTQASAIVITGLVFGTTYYTRAGVVTPVTGSIAWSSSYTVVAGSSTTPSAVTYTSTLTGTIGGVSVTVTPASVPTDIGHYEAVWVTDGSTPGATAPATWAGVPDAATHIVFFIGSHTGQTVDVYLRAVNTAGQTQTWTHFGAASATADALQQQSSISGTDSGTANAYAVTLTPAPTITQYSVVVFKATHTNTGASTLSVNGGSAIAIKKQASTALAAGDIVAGEIITVVNDGTIWQMQTSGASTGITAITGDGTATGPGSAALTISKINGTSLAGLATGILKNTTSTGVPSIAVAADFPTLNQNTTGTAANVSGTPALPNGTTATTQTVGDNSTKIATTAFVLANVGGGGGGGGAAGGLFAGLMSTIPTQSNTGLTTAYNQQGTFSVADIGHGILFKETAALGNLFEGVLKTYPGVPFTLTTLMTPPQPAANYSETGILIADTLTGKASLFGLLNYGGGFYHVLYNNSNPNTNVSAPLFSNSAMVNTNIPWIWLRIKDDGTNITYSASYDGYFFTQLYTSTKAAFYLGASGFNYLGFGVDPNGAAGATVLQSWTITTP